MQNETRDITHIVYWNNYYWIESNDLFDYIFLQIIYYVSVKILIFM